MWDLPGPGLEPVSPALAGRLSTTVPPGKPTFTFKYGILVAFIKPTKKTYFPCKSLPKQLRKLTSWDSSLYIFFPNAKDVSNFTVTYVESHDC